MERLIETLSTFLEKRVKSTFWPYFLLSFTFFHRKIIYVTFFVSEQYLWYDEHITRLDYVVDTFSIWKGIVCPLCYSILALAAGSFLSAVFSWVGKIFEIIHYWGHNGLESMLKPYMKEHIRIQNEYHETVNLRIRNDEVLDRLKNVQMDAIRQANTLFDKANEEVRSIISDIEMKNWVRLINEKVQFVESDDNRYMFLQGDLEMMERKAFKVYRSEGLLEMTGLLDSKRDYTLLGKSVRDRINANGKSEGAE
jgi:hypothetical protein